VKVWLDKEDLLSGQDWESEIHKAVREADVVIVCLSKQFNQRGFRQKEVKWALDTAMEQPEDEIFIVPARLEKCETLESLRKWHWVDLFENDGYNKLIYALQKQANKTKKTLHIKRNSQFKEPISITSTTFNVAPLGNINITEADNAISLANKTQKAFRFKFHPNEVVSIKDENFLLDNGALDLDKSLKGLLRRKKFNELMNDRLVLITSKPYSNQDLVNQYSGKDIELIQQCFFYDTEAVKNVALISSYIWDHLPRRKGLLSSLSGQRALEPYLIYSFAMTALDFCVGEIHHHDVIRGCPLDYCEDVYNIDRFFLKERRFCDECERILKQDMREDKITLIQLNSIKKMFKIATGES
jgi:hypothetical protein